MDVAFSILIPVNTALVLGLAYWVGRYTQRIENIEATLSRHTAGNGDIAIGKVEVRIEELTRRFEHLHRSVHDLKNQLIGRHLENDLTMD